MEENKRLRKLGIIKATNFNKNFNKIYDEYKIKAESLGYYKELKFIKERNKVIVYMECEILI